MKKKTYTKKQITEAIAYWKKQLKKMNESADPADIYSKYGFDHFDHNYNILDFEFTDSDEDNIKTFISLLKAAGLSDYFEERKAVKLANDLVRMVAELTINGSLRAGLKSTDLDKNWKQIYALVSKIETTCYPKEARDEEDHVKDWIGNIVTVDDEYYINMTFWEIIVPCVEYYYDLLKEYSLDYEYYHQEKDTFSTKAFSREGAIAKFRSFADDREASTTDKDFKLI